MALPSEVRRGRGKYCAWDCYIKSSIGHNVSTETRKKIAASRLGDKNWVKRPEVREKIRQALLGRDMGGHKKKCKTCKTPFRCNPSDKTINCSRKCSSKYFSQFSGERSHSWKGGLTPEHLLDRRGIKYKEWRCSVFERDHFTCQKTGVKGGKLVAHHIKNFSKYPGLRFAVNNGITLSLKSHNEFHKIYGKRNNTPEQLVEFINNRQTVSQFYQPLFNINKLS